MTDSTATEIAPDSHERFINRELSWLAFNERVLEEAWNPDVPLLERVRFLAISATNLNEFYMVRVAGLNGQVEAGIGRPSQDGMTPAEQLTAISTRACALMDDQQRCWKALATALREHDIFVLDEAHLDDADREWLADHFMREIFPVLSPIASDPAHPFPFIPNLGFSLVVRFHRAATQESFVGLVPIPHGLPRFVRLPGAPLRFIPVEQVIRTFVDRLFPGLELQDAGVFRVLRDSGIEIEEEAEDLVREFERLLRERRRGAVVRLTTDRGMSDDLRAFLASQLGVDSPDLLATQDLLGLADTSEIVEGAGVPGASPPLFFPPFAPRSSERVADYDGDCFAAIRQGDFIVHHPYEEFDVVVEFLRQAAADPDVVSIKQTLYRTSDDSPVVAALAMAAYAGKSVTAMVELRARFDEERNLRWARNLERAGVNVVYGFVRLKTHAKVSLVVRREGYAAVGDGQESRENGHAGAAEPAVGGGGGLRAYAHFGTGNYHPVTARVYADLSFFTCDPVLCSDAGRLFNYMTSTVPPEGFEKIAASPLNLRERLTELIDAEMEHAREGRPCGIVAKLNALVDGGMIDHFYRASQAGVPIDLVVRGICALRPGVPGLSENIRVKSIVGRFLEHSRILCFAAGQEFDSGEAKVFISSADLMPRNLDRRVETLVPIESPEVRHQVLDRIVRVLMKDDAQSWQLDADGGYTRVRSRRKRPYCAHDHFMREATSKKKKKRRRRDASTFATPAAAGKRGAPPPSGNGDEKASPPAANGASPATPAPAPASPSRSSASPSPESGD